MTRALTRPLPRLRLLVATGLAALVAPLGVAAVSPDVAGADPAAAEETGAAPTPTPGGPQSVTLVTGDVVTLTGSGPTGYAVDVEQADRPGHVRFLTQAGPDGVYVLPSDAIPAIEEGWLDRELFHVSYLAEHGLADADSPELPVIVSYTKPGSEARRADQLPGSGDVVGLSSINGAGVQLDKDVAADFWKRVGAPDARRTGRSAPDIEAVWLDGVAEVVLDESVPLVRAPVAWEAGFDGTGVRVAVLDTGVDANHPDLADQVVASESFVEGLPPVDGHGHGTHVASTILGTGAAEDGRYRGVAPGAELVSGKVCDDTGQVCPLSSMIAGMEWAATEMDAAVVSMSLSSWQASDGTDVVSQAVDSLTASTGSLFVIAAGNAGGGESTVGSPGAADAALTVAATDKSDRLASFSSRGPRLGDLALKPDIAAPGVDIVAARAEGTSLGRPVDDLYTASDGTSMATPHVSGAAAILAQAHPGWEPARMKAALMSTATDAGHTVYQQGAGRLDVGRAATQDVFSDTPNLDYGMVTLPRAGEPEQEPIGREISYTNLSDAPVTLSLSTSLRTTAGASVPAGALTTDPTVTVPAGGTATVPVTLDLAGLGEAGYTGAVVATDAATDVSLRTPVGLVRKPPMVDLTIHTKSRTGKPIVPWGQDIVRLDGPGGRVPPVPPSADGTTTVRVPAGIYSVMQAVDWVDDESRLNSAMLLEPELDVAADTEVTLDVRRAEQISFDTPRPAEPLNNRTATAYQRTTERGQPLGVSIYNFAPVGAWTRVWATPTEQVETGRLRFWTQALLGKSEVDLDVIEPVGLDLHPVAPLHFEFNAPSGTGELIRYQDFHPDFVPFTGTQRLRVVDVGSGSPEELADAHVDGRLALMAAAARFESGGAVSCGVDIARVQAVRNAGAAGILLYPAADHPCGRVPIPLPIVQGTPAPRKDVGIPNVHISTEEGRVLQRRLDRRPVTIRVTSTPETPYSYALKVYEEGRIPDSLDYRFTRRDLGEVELDYHAPRATAYSEERMVFKPDDVVRISMDTAYSVTTAFFGPRSRTEYFGPVSDEVVHTRLDYGRQGGLAPVGFYNRVQRESDPQLFVQPEQAEQQWFVAPKTPGPAMASDAVHELLGPGSPAFIGPCHLCRQDGYLYALFRMVTGAPGERQHDSGTGSAEYSSEESSADLDVRLFRGGTEIEPDPGIPWKLFPMPEEPGRYKLTGTGPQTDVTWTFDSDEPTVDTRRDGYMCFLEMAVGSRAPCAPEPIVYVSYDLADSLAMDNTVRAPGTQRFTVHAYHAPSDVAMPEIAGLKLWVSYGDDRWKPVQVQAVGDGAYSTKVVHPKARDRASDLVDLRVEARDEDGNRIEQITRAAYRLR